MFAGSLRLAGTDSRTSTATCSTSPSDLLPHGVGQIRSTMPAPTLAQSVVPVRRLASNHGRRISCATRPRRDFAGRWASRLLGSSWVTRRHRPRRSTPKRTGLRRSMRCDVWGDRSAAGTAARRTKARRQLPSVLEFLRWRSAWDRSGSAVRGWQTERVEQADTGSSEGSVSDLVSPSIVVWAVRNGDSTTVLVVECLQRLARR